MSTRCTPPEVPHALRGFVPPGQELRTNRMFAGNGRQRSFARCGVHSSESTGTWRFFLGRKQWHGPCHAGRNTESVAQATNGAGLTATNSQARISQPSQTGKQ